jgi:GH43 family beta-xylosidase
MRPAMLLITILATGTATTLSAQDASPPMTYPNPLVHQRADPHVTREPDGTYLMTASCPEYDRIELRRAKSIADLGEKAETKVVWRKHASGPMSFHIWAPELHRINGKWFIYFAAGERESIWKIRPYALSNESADPLEGEWKEEGRIQTDFDDFSLDATTFEHHGKRYMVWAQKNHDGDNTSDLFIALMTSPTTLQLPSTRISKPTLPWEIVGHKVNEGASVIIRNGKVYLAYSASATDQNYCVGLLTADEDADLLDAKSWTKHPEPILSTDEGIKEYGPGHNSFTVAEDGKTDLFIYHARDYPGARPDPLNDPNRHTRVRRVVWKSDGSFELVPAFDPQ